MLLCLVRHAEAKREGEDLSRPLSENGKREAEAVASYLSRLNLPVGRIFHSSKLRARQTAGILRDALSAGHRAVRAGLEETSGLLPMDDPGIWADRLEGMSGSVMLVGHLPHIGRLASLLACGDSEKARFSFSTAGVVCLERMNAAEWSVNWMITPEMLPPWPMAEYPPIIEGDSGL